MLYKCKDSVYFTPNKTQTSRKVFRTFAAPKRYVSDKIQGNTRIITLYRLILPSLIYKVRMRIYIIRRSLINENLGKDTLFCLYILLSRIFCRFKGLFCKVEIAIYVKILENARKSKKFCEKSAFFFRKSFVGSENVRTFASQSRNKGCLSKQKNPYSMYCGLPEDTGGIYLCGEKPYLSLPFMPSEPLWHVYIIKAQSVRRYIVYLCVDVLLYTYYVLIHFIKHKAKAISGTGNYALAKIVLK